MTLPLILFYGDSRAAAWPALPLSGVQWANLGLPGDDTAGALHRFPRDVAPLAPDIIVLQLGINDLLQTIHLPFHQAEIISACQTNLSRLVAQATALGATVILTTIFPPAADPWTGWSADHDTLTIAIDQVNHHLRGLLLVGGPVHLWETGPLLTEQGRIKPEYARDTLHLNPAGYAALNQALGSRLETLLHPERKVNDR